MKKKYLFIGVTICLVILLSIGVSYSYWKYTYTADEVNNIDSTCFSLSLSDSNPINLTNAYPITDDEGKKLDTYTFTITNSGDNETCAYANYTVSLEMLNGTNLSSDYVAVWLNKGTSTSASVYLLNSYTKNDTVYYSEDKTYYDKDNNIITTGKSTESRQLVTGGLAAGKSVTYTLGLWIDESVEIDDDAMNKDFKAKIIVTGEPGDEPPSASQVTLTKLGVDSDGPITDEILSTEVNDTNSGIYEVEDDYGTSYVFRGTSSATNNYVQFGEYSSDVWAGYNSSSDSSSDSYGRFYTYSSESECTSASSYNVNCTKIISAGDKMYWRVIRINGDGSIRLLYNGTSTTDMTFDNLYIQTTAYNSSYNNPMYVGYMYGEDVSSTDITSLTDEEKQVLYDRANANTHDSTIKTVLDTWYSKYLSSYSSYLADSGFCNDRSIYASGSSNYYQNTKDGGGYLTKKNTLYGGYKRNLSSSPTSSLKCPQNNDFFTKGSVSTTTGLTGNAALTYPIGLITLDELTMAGQGVEIYDSNVWTGIPGYVPEDVNFGTGYWSLTPSGLYRSQYAEAEILVANYSGNIKSSQVCNSVLGLDVSGARPVINLTSDATISEGSGTAEEPYVITVR